MFTNLAAHLHLPSQTSLIEKNRSAAERISGANSVVQGYDLLIVNMPRIMRLLKVMKPSCLVLIVSGLLGCASSSVSDRYQFESLDTEDSSKRFTYSAFIRGVGGVAQEQGAGQAQGTAGPARARSVNVEDMKKELEGYMAVTGYCGQGYFIYDETFDGVEYLLHGECQESKNNE